MARPKAAWKCVRFADMVTSAGATRKARGWTAGDEGVERYVGLEHLDANSPEIRRWGSPDTVGENSDLRHFEAGDVILARRGIEQRKVGVAEFRGVASGHALVFRARPELLLPEFLPYFLLSDVFMNRALDFSAGSLSKTVNLSALMKQEFPLPPLEEQRRIADLVRAASQLQSESRALHSALTAARRAFLVDVFRPDRGPRDRFPEHWKVVRAAAAGDCQLGQQRHPMFDQGDNVRPYLRVANVFDGAIDLSDVLSMHFPRESLSKFELKAGDILLNEGQSTELVGRSAIWRSEVAGMCIQKTLLRFRCSPQLLPEFAHAFFQHMLYTGQFARVAVQTTSIAHLTSVRFAELLLPVPPLAEQKLIVGRLVKIGTAEASASARAVDAASTARRILNSVLIQ
jgi:type I restriction enzyme, S subunit